MALSPPKASRAGLLRPPRGEERYRRFYAHPSDCDGLHPLDSSDSVWRGYL